MNRSHFFAVAGVLGLVAVAAGVAAQSLDNEPKASRPAKVPEIPRPDFTKADTYTVARVIDGDTIVVKTPSGLVTVRLWGVDTPETVHPSKPVKTGYIDD